MIVEALFSYSVDVRLKGRSRFNTVNAVSSVMVDVPELTGADAPVAFWHRGATLERSYQVAARHYDGRLFEPLVVANKKRPELLAEDCTSLRMTRSRVAQSKLPRFAGPGVLDVIRAARFFDNSPHGISAMGEVTGDRVEEMPVSELRYSAHDHEAEKRRGQFESLAVIDGVLHMQIEAPLFEVTSGYGTTIKPGVPSSLRPEVPANVFGVLEFDRALKLALRSKERYHKRGDMEWLRPEIVRADLIDFDVDRYVAEATVDIFLSRMGTRHTSWNGFSSQAPHVAGLSRDKMLAHARLREAREGGADVSVLCGLMGDMADLLGRGGYYRDEVDAYDRMMSRFAEDGILSPEHGAKP